MQIIPRIVEKIGSIGVIGSAIGCAGCFPALGALGASLGLGVLSSYEGVLINKLLPLFAVIALLANSYGWYKHRVNIRGVLSIVGPIAVLATLYPLWKYGWSTYLFYIGLIFMLVVSLLDVIYPAKSRCEIS